MKTKQNLFSIFLIKNNLTLYNPISKKIKDQNLLNKLSDKTLTNGWCNIDQRTIVISTGPDFVNITNLVITGSNDKAVKVEYKFKIIKNILKKQSHFKTNSLIEKNK